MLSNLSIRNIVLIEKLDIGFESGLSVLTGETGAGKSILLDGLALALGARGDAGLVREGEERGEVTAVFDLPPDHAAFSILRQSDADLSSGDDGSLVLRRVQTSDGRTRAFVNDRPVSASLLQSLASTLVEIHGQHDERALIDAGGHRALLDAFGGLEEDAGEVGRAFTSQREAHRALDSLRKRVEEAAKDADYLRASVEELESLSPTDGEEEQLAEDRQHMMKAETLSGDIGEAQEILSGGGSPTPVLSSLLRRLERKNAEAPDLLTDTVEALGRSIDALSEAEMAVDAAMRAAQFDPHRLESVEERLFALRAASRKYKVPVSALPELAAKMMADLAEFDAGEDRLRSLEAAEREAKALLDSKAKALSEKRAHAARALEAAVESELPALKLEHARFLVVIEQAEVGQSGIDDVSFHVQTNPGTRAGPIMKVASGGELSRFLLALKVALADRGSAPTLVFDEIDTGSGGAVADAIGSRLGSLSQSVQVLSVTHAPQVAARANTHYLISKMKAGNGETVATSVGLMDSGQRKEEIARMLAGAVITDEARAAAGRLIAAAS